jgi:probable rRNA maturation factor
MSVGVDVSAEGVRPALSRARVAELVRGVLRAERVRDALVSVAFVDDRTIARLNREHLGHRGPTDVITFALPAVAGGPVVGDVYVAPRVVSANARAHGRPAREELARVVIHATLHVLGREHPEDDGRTASPMWRRQEALLRRLYGDLAP